MCRMPGPGIRPSGVKDSGSDFEAAFDAFYAMCPPVDADAQFRPVLMQTSNADFHASQPQGVLIQLPIDQHQMALDALQVFQEACDCFRQGIPSIL